jgi:hypothetical protein
MCVCVQAMAPPVVVIFLLFGGKPSQRHKTDMTETDEPHREMIGDNQSVIPTRSIGLYKQESIHTDPCVLPLDMSGFYINVENLPLGARWVPQVKPLMIAPNKYNAYCTNRN